MNSKFEISSAISLYILLTISLCNNVVMCNGFRIVNGQLATHEIMQYVVHIRITSGAEVYGCGGAIIREDVIITAAHCMSSKTKGEFPAAAYKVSAGLLSTQKPESTRQTCSVRLALAHEKYDRKMHANDIGMLFLKEKLSIDNKTVAIAVPAKISPSSGTECIIGGWGSAGEGLFNQHNAYFFRTKSQGPGYCLSKFGTVFVDGMLCTYNPDNPQSAACSGDSGSPLITVDDKTIVGLMSYSLYGCNGSNPDVYVDVGFYNAWIMQHMNDQGSAAEQFHCSYFISFIFVIVQIFCM